MNRTRAIERNSATRSGDDREALVPRACAACGGKRRLRALDDAEVVWFCADCWSAAHVTDADEFTLDLGTAD
jgi:hypothetical protein